MIPLFSPVSSSNHKKGPGHICQNLSHSSNINYGKKKDTKLEMFFDSIAYSTYLIEFKVQSVKTGKIHKNKS